MSGSTFKSLGKNVLEDYIDGIKIYLESSEDVDIFGRKWFSHLKDKISFESVSPTRADGGCQKVLRKVQESNYGKQNAYGIVDRDILLSDVAFRESLWWETDNHKLTSAKPYQAGAIFVLHYWELENYLLHPTALALLIQDKTLSRTPIISDVAIAETLIQHEENLIAVTMLSSVATKLGKTQASEQFAKDLHNDELMHTVKNHLVISDEEISQESEKIKCFAEYETDAVSRWQKLSRMLDGKRIMYRLDTLFSARDFADCKVSLKSERGVLAGYIAQHKLIDANLTAWLDDIYRLAV